MGHNHLALTLILILTVSGGSEKSLSTEKTSTNDPAAGNENRIVRWEPAPCLSLGTHFAQTCLNVILLPFSSLIQALSSMYCTFSPLQLEYHPSSEPSPQLTSFIGELFNVLITTAQNVINSISLPEDLSQFRQLAHQCSYSWKHYFHELWDLWVVLPTLTILQEIRAQVIALQALVYQTLFNLVLWIISPFLALANGLWNCCILIADFYRWVIESVRWLLHGFRSAVVSFTAVLAQIWDSSWMFGFLWTNPIDVTSFSVWTILLLFLILAALYLLEKN